MKPKLLLPRIFFTVSIACLFVIILFSNCSNTTINSSDLILETITLSDAGLPNLFVSDNGNIYLTWVKTITDTQHTLYYSIWNGKGWSPGNEISTGEHWFVNWADFPSLIVGNGGKDMSTFWLEKNKTGIFDYFINVTQSSDYGKSWTSPFIPHPVNHNGEYGFVSLVKLKNDKNFMIWLDARNANTEEHTNNHHSHSGHMALYGGYYNQENKLSNEVLLDGKVCDCCQTDAINTDAGIVLAYRDKTDESIRDITVLYQEKGIWKESFQPLRDNWEIGGCPVNGPALAGNGQYVGLAWFTMSDDKPKVLFSLSSDTGRTFGKPVLIDDSDVMGRVDIISVEKDRFLISYLKDFKDEAEISVVEVYDNTVKDVITDKIPVTSSRSSGFPRMVLTDNQVFLTWSIDSINSVKTAIFDWN